MTSKELLELEDKIGSGGQEGDSLMIIESVKRKPISRVDTSAILRRAKDFLKQTKQQDEPVQPIESDSSSEVGSNESSDQKVEISVLLFPETAVDNNTHLNRLKDLLIDEESTDSEEEEDITEQ